MNFPYVYLLNSIWNWTHALQAAALMYSSYTIASNNRECGLQIKKRQTTKIRFNQSFFSVPTMVKQPPLYSTWERF